MQDYTHNILFQPTSPCGGRRAGERSSVFRLGISTHVPMRGTTACPGKMRRRDNDFNPRPHAGDDWRGYEGRAGDGHFNPRPHAGDDGYGLIAGLTMRISTHVPMRGTTTPPPGPGATNTDFNPRPHAGDDCSLKRGHSCGKHFNPRPHAGDDIVFDDGVTQDRHFNPRPHAGDDPSATVIVSRTRYFNPRPHAGDDCTAGGDAQTAL